MARIEVTADELLAELAAQLPGDFDPEHEISVEDLVARTGRSYMRCLDLLRAEAAAGRMTWRYAVRDGRRVRAFRQA